jgi:hypothetical protein
LKKVRLAWAELEFERRDESDRDLTELPAGIDQWQPSNNT